jgi:hypothetical protein
MSAVRSIKLLIGLFGLAAVMTAAPIQISSDGLSLDTKVAAAKPGNGKGRGNGRALGRGGLAEQSSGGQGLAHGKTGSSAGGARGQANGRALGHVDKDAVSGVEHAPPGQAKKEGYDGVKGPLGVQGSFNAVHSAAINKGVVSPNSRVARVKAYLDAAQEVSDIENGEEGTDPNDLEAAIEAAAVAAADASSQTVTSDMLGKVNDYSNARELTEPGIDMSDDTRDEVADEAQDIQSGS